MYKHMVEIHVSKCRKTGKIRVYRSKKLYKHMEVHVEV